MYLPCDPAGALTPFGDLHNHRAPPGPALPDLGLEGQRGEGEKEGKAAATWGDGAFNLLTREYVIYAGARYRKGEQVFLSYGALSNLELLEHYGFMLEENAHDQCALSTETVREALGTCRSHGLAAGDRAGPLLERDCWLHRVESPAGDFCPGCGVAPPAPRTFHATVTLLLKGIPSAAPRNGRRSRRCTGHAKTLLRDYPPACRRMSAFLVERALPLTAPGLRLHGG
eukprot:jgi/Botrbrau1/15893/Bobra.40_1s0076.1